MSRSDLPKVGPHGLPFAEEEFSLGDFTYPADMVEGAVLRMRPYSRSGDDVLFHLSAVPRGDPSDPERQWMQGFEEGVAKGAAGVASDARRDVGALAHEMVKLRGELAALRLDSEIDSGFVKDGRDEDLFDEEIADLERDAGPVPGAQTILPTTGSDPWAHRSAGMRCSTCMFYVPKKGGGQEVGRCRRHAPTMGGYPAVFPTDWCGDHKLDETKLGRSL